ncbi:MAG: type secretion system protein VirB10 [Sphingomonadales bacterium]|nr:type secretion system protein VirB10 [Sphingomonadales bacterium]
MTRNKATIEATANTVRGPWDEPSRPSFPVAVPATDPRLELSENALVVASQNAFPIVASRKTRRDHLGLAAGGAIALVLGVATFVSLSSGRHPATSPAASPTAVAQPQSGLPMPSAVPGRPMAMPPGTAMPATNPQAGAMPGMNHMPGMAPMPGMAQPASPVLVFDGSSAPGTEVAIAGPNTPRGADGAPALLSGAEPGSRGFASDSSSVRSSKLAEPANTVIQGTLIPAVLETAIDTDIPGYVRAVVSQDVKSFDGSRILIPRSSRLIGEYKGATQAGQRRAYLMWTRLVRPDGVSIALASPAADLSGQAGVGGQVNSHFFSRFGSSILLSILGGAGGLLTGGASTVIVGGAGQSAASVAAQHDGARGPTIKVHQGEPIRVFTARDLIFTSDESTAG